MKKVLALMMMTANAFAVERSQLLPLIESATTNRETAYVEIRDKIVVYGKDALPILNAIAVNETLPWQQQLVARICKERIERENDIKKLLATDWYSHPDFEPRWSQLITGPIGPMTKLIFADLQEAGLWYYCLEQVWKTTGEVGEIYKNRDGESWVGCCATAVKDNPEERIWFLRVCADLIDTTPPPPRLSWLQSMLTREGKPDTMEVLEKYNTKFPPPPPRPHPPAPPPNPAFTPVPVDYGTNPDGSKKLPPGLSRNPPANN